jgi:predicted dehydrogenase
MSVRSRTTIFNAALLRTGNSDAPEGDGGALWRAMDANYSEIVRACFEDGNGSFPFGKARQTLTSRIEGSFGYDDAFVLPTEAIHVSEVYFNGYAAADIQEHWEVDGAAGTVLVNAQERAVEVEYIREGLEHTWSAGFTLAVQRRLEAVIKDVLEESEEAAAKEQEADFHLMKAAVKGSRNRSAQKVWKQGGGRLMRARRTPWRV